MAKIICPHCKTEFSEEGPFKEKDGDKFFEDMKRVNKLTDPILKSKETGFHITVYECHKCGEYYLNQDK